MRPSDTRELGWGHPQDRMWSSPMMAVDACNFCQGSGIINEEHRCPHCLGSGVKLSQNSRALIKRVLDAHDYSVEAAIVRLEKVGEITAISRDYRMGVGTIEGIVLMLTPDEVKMIVPVSTVTLQGNNP